LRGVGDIPAEHFAVPLDDGEQVVEVMGNPGRQLPHGFEPGALALLGFDAAALGHIALDGHPVGVVAGCIGNRHNRQLGPERAAILAVVDEFNRDGLPVLQRLPNPGAGFRRGFRPLEHAWRLPNGFERRVARHLLKRPVDVENPRPGRINRLGFGHKHDIVDVVQNGFKQLDVFPVGHILGHIP
jgi:hypothetical protein